MAKLDTVFSNNPGSVVRRNISATAISYCGLEWDLCIDLLSYLVGRLCEEYLVASTRSAET